MLKRKTYNSITNRYKINLKKCLLVDGARQIGKTYSFRKFFNYNSNQDILFILPFLS